MSLIEETLMHVLYRSTSARQDHVCPSLQPFMIFDEIDQSFRWYSCRKQ